MKNLEKLLEQIENACMHLKLRVRENDYETARTWHRKIETLTQNLYDSEMYREFESKT